MLKQVGRIESKIGDKLFHFYCEGEAKWGEVHDALSEMKGHVLAKMQEIHEASKPKEEKTDEQASS